MLSPENRVLLKDSIRVAIRSITSMSSDTQMLLSLTIWMWESCCCLMVRASFTLLLLRRLSILSRRPSFVSMWASWEAVCVEIAVLSDDVSFCCLRSNASSSWSRRDVAEDRKEGVPTDCVADCVNAVWSSWSLCRHHTINNTGWWLWSGGSRGLTSGHCAAVGWIWLFDTAGHRTRLGIVIWC